MHSRYHAARGPATAPIAHATLRRAAEQLTTVCDAGYAEQVRREYHERLADAGIRRTAWRDPLADWRLRERAELLSLVTSAPLSQCLVAIREASGDLPERDVGLTMLRELAGEVRRVEAQAARQRTRGRATP
jgi:hypothetical protein